MPDIVLRKGYHPKPDERKLDKPPESLLPKLKKIDAIISGEKTDESAGSTCPLKSFATGLKPYQLKFLGSLTREEIDWYRRTLGGDPEKGRIFERLLTAGREPLFSGKHGIPEDILRKTREKFFDPDFDLDSKSEVGRMLSTYRRAMEKRGWPITETDYLLRVHVEIDLERKKVNPDRRRRIQNILDRYIITNEGHEKIVALRLCSYLHLVQEGKIRPEAIDTKEMEEEFTNVGLYVDGKPVEDFESRVRKMIEELKPRYFDETVLPPDEITKALSGIRKALKPPGHSE